MSSYSDNEEEAAAAIERLVDQHYPRSQYSEEDRAGFRQCITSHGEDCHCLYSPTV